MDRPKLNITKDFKEAIDEVKDMIEIIDILMTDMRRIIETSEVKTGQLKEAPESLFLNEQETWNRITIRLLITTIDAVCFKLKQIVVIGHKIRNKPLDKEDIIRLTEIKENGKPFIWGTEKNLEYTFKMFAATFDSNCELIHGKEWPIFQKVIKKRRGLTHPKNRADLSVTITDYKDAADITEWFEQLSQIMMSFIR